MNIIDEILNEWSYRCPDGVVDINNPNKVSILNEILKENGLDEIKVDSLHIGVSFDLNGDFGNFKRGDRITLKDKKAQGNDVELTFENQDGVKDTFIIDENDDFEGEISEDEDMDSENIDNIDTNIDSMGGENDNEIQEDNSPKTWSEGFKEGYLRGYEDALNGKNSIFSLEK